MPASQKDSYERERILIGNNIYLRICKHRKCRSYVVTQVNTLDCMRYTSIYIVHSGRRRGEHKCMFSVNVMATIYQNKHEMSLI